MAENVAELVQWARVELRARNPWHVVSSGAKLSKTLFEFEEDTRHYIGKVSKSQDASRTFERMKRVWDAGMKPPSRYQIAEPVAWLPERLLLIQSKAEGTAVLQLVQDRNPLAMQAIEQAAGWLHALQHLRADLPVDDKLPGILDRCRRELGDPRVFAVLDGIRDRLTSEANVVSHGDFHPLNLYCSDNGSLTAIDLDTLALREPAFDVAWFLAQLAVMGHHVFGSFQPTAELRKRFRECSPRVPEERVQMHIRFALIRSLHYDLCILKVKDRDHVDAFLHAAEHGLE